jgi:hypothetical protein
MTQPTPTPYAIHSQSSLIVRPAILARAEWTREPTADGRMAFRPVKDTWYGHIVRGRHAHDVVIVPMVGCPGCGGLLFLSHTEATAKVLRAVLGQRVVPVVHSIDYLGKVAPDLLCGRPRCDFHRQVYLDRWNKTKPLFALAYVNTAKGNRIEIAYSHSVDEKEARFHLGMGPYRVIGGGPAIGFFVDEKTGRITAEAG